VAGSESPLDNAPYLAFKPSKPFRPTISLSLPHRRRHQPLPAGDAFVDGDVEHAGAFARAVCDRFGGAAAVEVEGVDRGRLEVRPASRAGLDEREASLARGIPLAIVVGDEGEEVGPEGER